MGSDAKSDIEALRWVIVRRCVLGILSMAVLTVGTIRYIAYVTHKQEKEAAQRAREEEERKKNYGRVDSASSLEAAEILAAN
jgi:Tfp pilus assembly protein PilO